jgi:hypothetical protein
MHGIMEKTLESLYTCPRGLLRRWRWKVGVRVINFFFKWSNSPNFWVAPRIRDGYSSSAVSSIIKTLPASRAILKGKI